MLKPIEVACPACQSKPGELCTAPDDRSRHYIKSFHLAREDRAQYPKDYEEQ